MSSSDRLARVKIVIQGAVQGVGFRPFIYRLAQGLTGWVNNTAQGVFIEAEGSPAELEAFVQRIPQEKPPHAIIQSMQVEWLEPFGYTEFSIQHSDGGGGRTALILPEIATCPDCQQELFDPQNRRYRYPFTNCTNCGPRFTIIADLPYDRPFTTMKDFPLCDDCLREYEDPLDRRFHAQPNACPVCGPYLAWWGGGDQKQTLTHDAALRAAEDAIRAGRIVAVKGLGGFHLICDARNDSAVRRLREAKHRPDKPFALMFPSLAAVEAVCHVSDVERDLLESAQAPIVILDRRDGQDMLAPSIAPDNPTLGAMLPYTPLHHLLLADLGFPVVATSGNRSDEPICINEAEARERLGGIAEAFLVHNRPILRPVDDSVLRVMGGRMVMIRRARGYAPLPLKLPAEQPVTLAVGAHLKNTAAITRGDQVFVSQHIGDLETPQAYESFQRIIADFQQMYDLRPERVVCDLHPDYVSTAYARETGLPLVTVQHHLAHVLACMVDNQLDAPVLGVSWDGTGYGEDGVIWGGEFFLITADKQARRVAHLRPFRLPGGEAAIKEPRRSAAGLLYELNGTVEHSAFTEEEQRVILAMLQRGLNAPLTTSTGRLFDAVSSLLGYCQRTSFEGHGAMMLEFAMNGMKKDDGYNFNLRSQGDTIIIDWELMIRELMQDDPPIAAIRFHNTLTEMILQVAQQIGVQQVALTGGCFQNRYLTERTIHRLQDSGFEPYWHHHIPPNDGGISVGQSVYWEMIE